MDIHTAFCNMLLRVIAKDVKKADPAIGVQKSAWVIKVGRECGARKKSDCDCGPIAAND